MTISAAGSRIEYSASGGQTTFAYPYRINASTDLQVYQNASLLLINSQYTVTGVGSPTGGNVILVVPAVAADKIVMLRRMPIQQTIDYIDGDVFPAQAHEDGLDRIVMMMQQVQEITTRCLQINAALSFGLTGLELPFPTTAPTGRWGFVWNALQTNLELFDLTAAIGIVSDTLTGSTVAGLPAAGTPGKLRRITDSFRGIMMDQGKQWWSVTRRRLSVAEFGAIGDGTSHPLSERYASLPLAQVDYPHATATTQTIDWAAIQGALNYAATYGRTVELDSDRRYHIGVDTVLFPRFSNLVGGGFGSQIIYSGTTAAIKADPATGFVTNWRAKLAEFTLRASNASSTRGIWLKDVADVELDHVVIDGRPTDTDPATGFTEAGLYLDSSAAPNGACITISLHQCYILSCVGDGIKTAAVNTMNSIQIQQCRIIQNLGWGIRFQGQARALTISHNKAIEGNAAGQVQILGFLGLEICANYFEHAGAGIQIDLLASNESWGVEIHGNHFQGSGTGTGVKLGTTANSFNVEGGNIKGNWFNNLGLAIDPQRCVGVDVGPNKYTAVTVMGNTFSFATGINMRELDAPSLNVLGYRSTASVVTNTAAEGALHTQIIKPSRLRTAGMVYVCGFGSILNNSGGSVDITLRLKYNGAKVVEVTWASIGASATLRPLWFEGCISGNGDVGNGSQRGWLKASLGEALGVTGVTSQDLFPRISVNSGQAIGDSTLQLNMDVAIQFSVANVNITATLADVRYFHGGF